MTVQSPNQKISIALFSAQKSDVGEWYIKASYNDNGEVSEVAEIQEKNEKISFAFLPEGAKYKLTLISDGRHDKEFRTQYLVVDRSSSVEVKMLRRGGFAAVLRPIL